MRDAEMFHFMRVFRELISVFNVRLDDDAITSRGSAYFRALRAWPIEKVIAGSEACMARCKHFPKPAEWIDLMPRQSTAQAVADIETMTEDEAREYRRAEECGYEDEPCHCRVCVAAGVDWKPIRFVPTLDAQDEEVRRRDPLRDRIVIAGHWAHGEELQRWYVARGQFYQRVAELGLTRTLKQGIGA